MDHAKVNAALGTVHAAQSAQEVAEAYAAWAARTTGRPRSSAMCCRS